MWLNISVRVCLVSIHMHKSASAGMSHVRANICISMKVRVGMFTAQKQYNAPVMVAFETKMEPKPIWLQDFSKASLFNI